MSYGCDIPQDRYDQEATKTKISIVADAARSLAKDCGVKSLKAPDFPAALLQNPGWPNWKGPYLTSGGASISLKDAWGVELRSVLDAGKLRIISAGSDHRFGTSDDIAVGVEVP